MKNLNYLMIVLFSVVLMATSCKKDSTEPVTNPVTPLITLSQLNGTWNFVNFQYDTVNYKTHANIANSTNDSVVKSNSLLTLVFTLNLNGYNGDNVVDFDSYVGDLKNNNFTLNTTTNQIIVYKWVWQILSYTATTNTLVLKCITGDTGFLVNGILTVQQ